MRRGSGVGVALPHDINRKSVQMFRAFRVFLVEIPALDRLMNYLEAAEQREIDAASEQVDTLTADLKQSQTALQGAIPKEK